MGSRAFARVADKLRRVFWRPPATFIHANLRCNCLANARPPPSCSTVRCNADSSLSAMTSSTANISSWSVSSFAACMICRRACSASSLAYSLACSTLVSSLARASVASSRSLAFSSCEHRSTSQGTGHEPGSCDAGHKGLMPGVNPRANGGLTGKFRCLSE